MKTSDYIAVTTVWNVAVGVWLITLSIFVVLFAVFGGVQLTWNSSNGGAKSTIDTCGITADNCNPVLTQCGITADNCNPVLTQCGITAEDCNPVLTQCGVSVDQCNPTTLNNVNSIYFSSSNNSLDVYDEYNFTANTFNGFNNTVGSCLGSTSQNYLNCTLVRVGKHVTFTCILMEGVALILNNNTDTYWSFRATGIPSTFETFKFRAVQAGYGWRQAMQSVQTYPDYRIHLQLMTADVYDGVFLASLGPSDPTKKNLGQCIINSYIGLSGIWRAAND